MVKNKKATRPPMTAEEKAAREKLREEKRGTMSNMALIALGNRGPAPIKHTDEFLNQIAEDLEAWSKLPNSHFIIQFCLDYKTPVDKDELQEYSKKHEVLGRAWKNADARTNLRLDEKALKKDIDPGFWSKIKPLKDKEFREWRMTELKMEAQSDHEKNITINIKPGIGLGQESIKTISVQEQGE